MSYLFLRVCMCADSLWSKSSNYIFFIISVNIQVSLYISQLILRALKLIIIIYKYLVALKICEIQTILWIIIGPQQLLMHSVEKDKDLLQYLWNYKDLLQYLWRVSFGCSFSAGVGRMIKNQSSLSSLFLFSFFFGVFNMNSNWNPFQAMIFSPFPYFV